jgi:serine/threonine protein kinase
MATTPKPPSMTAATAAQPARRPYTFSEFVALFSKLLHPTVSQSKTILITLRPRVDELDLAEDDNAGQAPTGSNHAKPFVVMTYVKLHSARHARIGMKRRESATGAVDLDFPVRDAQTAVTREEIVAAERLVRAVVPDLLDNDIIAISCDTPEAKKLIEGGVALPDGAQPQPTHRITRRDEVQRKRAIQLENEAVVASAGDGNEGDNDGAHGRAIQCDPGTNRARGSMLRWLAHVATEQRAWIHADTNKGAQQPIKLEDEHKSVDVKRQRTEEDHAPAVKHEVGDEEHKDIESRRLAAQSEQRSRDAVLYPAMLVLPCTDTDSVTGGLFGGRYKQGRKMGEGTFGEIVAAYDVNASLWVVLKVIRRLCHSGGGLQNTITREVNAFRLLRHTHLLRLLDVVYLPTTGAVVLVCPLVAHDLSGLHNYAAMLAEPKRLSLRDVDNMPTSQQRVAIVKGILVQMCEALRFLHHNGVIHRDIKLSNVLVHSDGRVLLCDFGWARIAAEIQRKRKLTWPPCALNYRPIDIYYGDDQYNESVDIYGLGCLLFDLLTHKTLFAGQSEAQVIESIVHIQGMPPDDVLKGIPKPFKQTLDDVDAAAARYRHPIGVATYCQQHGIPDAAAAELIASMVDARARARPTASEVLKHRWLTASPPAPFKEEEIAKWLPKTNTYYWPQKCRHRDT